MVFAVFFSVYLYTIVIKSKQLRAWRNELQDSSRARQDKRQTSCPASPRLLPSLPPLPLFFDLETRSKHLCMNNRKQSGSRLRNLRKHWTVLIRKAERTNNPNIAEGLEGVSDAPAPRLNPRVLKVHGSDKKASLQTKYYRTVCSMSP